jgi:glyoxylase-like metal-dependent hydrolase (beta-lactamase superfamily II)
MRAKIIGTVTALALAFLSSSAASQKTAPKVGSPRLYVMDCGAISNDRPEVFNLTRDEVSNTIMSDMCFLIVHPKGTMLWDSGIPDRFTGLQLGSIQSSRRTAYVKVRSVGAQLLDIGYQPEDINYLALSHAHWDHSGNANTFARSATWLVSQKERDYMFNPGGYTKGKADWDQLEHAKTIIVPDEYDVFGDGTVILRQAPGHTPGHSVAVVKLLHTGPVILAGDLYHYKEEITLDRMPDAERTSESPQSRAMVIGLAKKLNAQIWIAHDLDLSLRLQHSPAYYD